MKRTFFLLPIISALLPISARGELPIIVEHDDWLGHFVGWKERSYDYAFGDEGKGVIIPKAGRKLVATQSFELYTRIQQNRSGTWSALNGDYTSESEASLDPQKPVSIPLELEDSTKVKFIQTKTGSKIAFKADFIKTLPDTKNRLAVYFKIPVLNQLSN